ncbi:NAD(P)/FAD-dependent oxidoreductase [Paraburkholderia youngii]|uniref:FAD-binding oxidoreductase n=1 Tax=Paraburkholderia youngii TaxID=2782701 RepID=A0A7Y6N0H7_9BURK|nr:FAD-binding oxidoreductase [Paraburkholderia youngii]NUY04143.1 FAD-binding oxidoreductase [Paraburkholderia youngii]
MSSLLNKEQGVVEDSYYEASVTRAQPHPPLQEKLNADVCVIGAGYAGLSCALELAESGFDVALLEAQRIGWGASGRNGGHAIVGFGDEGEDAIEHQCSREVARRAWDVSLEGMRLLEDRLVRFGIDCHYRRGYLTLAVSDRKAEQLMNWVRRTRDRYDYPLEWLGRTALDAHIASQRFAAGVYDAGSGHLHPLLYCLGLGEAARHAGVRIFENSAVSRLDRGARPAVKTAEGEVSCDRVVMAGNVYLGEFGDHPAPEIEARIMPVGTYMIATEPLTSARADALMPGRAAASDNNLILDYFRLSADHRLLFGAGETYDATTPRNLIDRMRRRMTGVFPQLADVNIEYAWGGFVDVTMNRAPDLGRIGDNLYYVQGFSGHGLVFAGMAGKILADAIGGDASRFDVFSRIRHRRFPGGKRLRTQALVLGMWYYKLRELI